MIKFRLYYDKDAEQEWLRKMCLSGWAFKKFFLGFYKFKPCEPGEYNYQIDLLNGTSGDKKDYVSFMEDAGVEVVGQWVNWVYLQKRTADGPFEMYTDTASKIAQYTRIKKLFMVILPIEMLCFIDELIQTIYNCNYFTVAVAALFGFIVFVMFRMVWKCTKKIGQLKVENQ